MNVVVDSYFGIGLSVGSTLFITNLLSVLVPNNDWVDPKYCWEVQGSIGKAKETLGLVAGKAFVGGLTWPIAGLRLCYDICRVVSKRSLVPLYHFFNLGCRD